MAATGNSPSRIMAEISQGRMAVRAPAISFIGRENGLNARLIEIGRAQRVAIRGTT